MSRKSQPDSGVYFIQCAGFVKIGIAWSVRNRFITIQGSNPLPLIPLGFIAQDDPDELAQIERRLHDRFAAFRERGEWFVLTDQIQAYITQIASPWPWPLRRRVYGIAPSQTPRSRGMSVVPSGEAVPCSVKSTQDRVSEEGAAV